MSRVYIHGISIYAYTVDKKNVIKIGIKMIMLTLFL